MNKSALSFDDDILCRLKTGTAAIHEQIEQVSVMRSMMEGTLDKTRYTVLLYTLYHFYHALESRIQQHDFWHHTSFDIARRMKSGWLLHDIHFFGIHYYAKPSIAASLPDITSIEALLGVLYVIEGSTLGGTVIAKQLEKQYGYTLESGARFYHGYGKESKAFWQETGNLIRDSVSSLSLSEDKVIHFAQAMFACYERNMSHVL